jgi:hypothetical protein
LCETSFRFLRLLLGAAPGDHHRNQTKQEPTMPSRRHFLRQASAAGVATAPSAFGYKELGGTPEKLAAAQHCRAEACVKTKDSYAPDDFRYRILASESV